MEHDVHPLPLQEKKFLLLQNFKDLLNYEFVRGLNKDLCSSQVKDPRVLLDALAELLIQEEEDKTTVVAQSVSCLLLELLVRAEKRVSAKRLLVTLSHLIGFYPIATQFSRNKFALSEPQEDAPNFQSAQRHKSDQPSIKSLLTAYLDFLWFDPEYYRDKFQIDFFLDSLNHDEPEIKWLSASCLRIMSEMDESSFNSWISNHISQDILAKIRVKHLGRFKSRPPCLKPNLVAMKLFEDHHFSPKVVRVAEILMLRISTDSPSSNSDNLILVPSSKSCLQQLAQNVVAAKPILIEGPVGCGKTLLIDHLASRTGRDGHPSLIKVQMGDQIDSKLLIGGLFCTEVPGEFEWRPGPLTMAMKSGHWIVFEDVDYAPPDVMTILCAAVESRSLSSLPGSNLMGSAHCDFRVFFTRRLKTFSSSATSIVVEKLCQKITMQDMDRAELDMVINECWPSLGDISSTILNTYCLVKEQLDQDEAQNRRGTTRSVGMRDLVKWCKRLSKYYKPQSRKTAVAERAFMDAVDCFLPESSVRIEMTELLGTYLNVAKHEARKLAVENDPQPQFASNDVRIGRTTLSRDSRLVASVPSTFAFTQPSMSLLEKIATAVQYNEPILLVGETGSGKTSTVQYLSEVMGQTLTVVNLNQQTDSSDLLGGYKPLDVGLLIEPVVRQFVHLHRESFDGEKCKNLLDFNAKVELLLRQKQWKTLLQVIVSVPQRKLHLMKTDLPNVSSVIEAWNSLGQRAEELLARLDVPLAFTFVEGSLVKAMKNGTWILLDEINLAEMETLQNLSHVFDVNQSSIILVDKTDGKCVERHPDFRVFACMNPATDVGKKDLPLGIRNRFTEFFVDEIQKERDLQILVKKYSVSDESLNRIVSFYLKAKDAASKVLTDPNGHRPLYSLR